MKASLVLMNRIKNKDKYLKTKTDKFDFVLESTLDESLTAFRVNNGMNYKSLKYEILKKYPRLKKFKVLKTGWRELHTGGKKISVEVEVTYAT